MVNWTPEPPNIKEPVAAIIDAGFLYGLAAAWEHVKEEKDVLEKLKSFVRDNVFGKIPNFNGKFIFCTEGKHSFRREQNPMYKLNRKDKTRPKWLDTLYNFIKPNSFSVDYFEADDVAALYHTWYAQQFRQKKIDYRTMLVSADKDLVQAGGLLYRPPYNHKSKKYGDVYADVSPEDANRHLWLQALMGDNVDNIPGIERVGEVSALAILRCVDVQNIIAKRAKYEKNFTYRDAVYAHYVRKYGVKEGERMFKLNCDMVRLVTVDEDREYIIKHLEGVDFKDLIQK